MLNTHNHDASKLTRGKMELARLNNVYTIVDSAGKGDYTTLSAAIAANKTRIFVRNGTYVESSNIQITNNNTYIEGEDRDNTIIQFDASEDGLRIYASYCQVRNLTLDSETNDSSGAALIIGDGKASGSEDLTIGIYNIVQNCNIKGGSQTFALYVAGASYTTGSDTLTEFEAGNLHQGNQIIDNIMSSSFSGDAFVFALQKNSKINNNFCTGRIAFYLSRQSQCVRNTITSSVNNGIYVGGPVYDCHVSENIISNSTTTGIEIQNQVEHTPLLSGQFTRNNNINNNIITDCGYIGIIIAGASSYEAQYNNITKNSISNCQFHGIYMQYADYNNVSGNIIDKVGIDTGDTVRSGIYLYAAKDNKFDGNTIVDTTRAATSAIAHSIANREETGSTNNIVINNLILANTFDRHIWVQSDGWVISNNHVENGYYCGLYLDGCDNTLVTNNLFKNNTENLDSTWGEIWLNNTSNNNLFSNNYFHSTNTNKALIDIRIDSGTGNEVKHNMINGCDSQLADT